MYGVFYYKSGSRSLQRKRVGGRCQTSIHRHKCTIPCALRKNEIIPIIQSVFQKLQLQLQLQVLYKYTQPTIFVSGHKKIKSATSHPSPTLQMNTAPSSPHLSHPSNPLVPRPPPHSKPAPPPKPTTPLKSTPGATAPKHTSRLAMPPHHQPVILLAG